MRLTSKDAERMIDAAVAKAMAMGVPVNVAVLDEGAHLKAFRRMDGAPLGAIDLALGKAKTAALFGMNSDELFQFVKAGGPAEGMQFSNGILVTFAGGLVLKAPAGEPVGAIGVSGGTVPQDGEIAGAGAAALAASSDAAGDR
jgi:uncharacterized protein GlcG (DUF336 family)